MDMYIRQARAEDAAQAAALMLTASKDTYQFWLDTGTHSALAAFESAFIKNAGVKGYAKQQVAEVHGDVVGIAGAYLGKDVLKLEAIYTKWLLGFYPVKEWFQVVSRGLRLAKLVSGIPKDMLYVTNIGVREDMQGQGIATQLINSQRNVAKRFGCSQLGLDVSVDNLHAKRLYEYVGFRVIHESSYSKRADVVPNQLRMVMDIS